MSTLMALDFTGRDVLIVGAGAVSARRAQTFVTAGASVTVVAPELGRTLGGLVSDGLVTWLQEPVQAHHLDGAWFVHTATGDRATDLLVAEWANECRIWCVNASDASAGSAKTPATSDAGAVEIGVVSKEGADPRRSRLICDQLAEGLRAGHVDLRRHRPGAGRVVLVGGGPGDADLMTLRGRRALAEADVVVTDRLGPRSVLAELPAEVEIIDVGKQPKHHPVPQEEINRILVEKAQQGLVVVRLKGGDPFVYGRGGEEVLACNAAGVAVEVVPGISSAISVPAAAGIPVTHRGVANSFQVVTGHQRLGAELLRSVKADTCTLVVLMGVSALGRICAELVDAGVRDDMPVAIVENGHTPRQRVTRGSLRTIDATARSVGVANPAIIVIGEVAQFGLLQATRSLQEQNALSA
ncbi:uroporphyrinogen-III C-methyltransferase [Pseudoclavibacter terrae]|uniref:uroporphyrinogen-III C-methyltransferase n=1 Tax=Pseudoclavibacter terrae TaxID=1530195 RepID=UPI00232B363E|nr:uroporphyrinogen-III C-methyltransferase [Pseudoclavibacter terrae]